MQDIFKQQARNEIHTASSWLLWKFGQRRESAWECAEGFNLCWIRGGRAQPSPADKTHFPCRMLEEAGSSQVQPKPSLQSDTFLCWFIWQFKCDLGLEAQQLLKDLWCWDCLAGDLVTMDCSPQGCSALCYGSKRWNLTGEIPRAGAGITSSLRQQGQLPIWKSEELNQYRTLQHQRGPEEAARCRVLGQLSTGKNPLHRGFGHWFWDRIFWEEGTASGLTRVLIDYGCWYSLIFSLANVVANLELCLTRD